jgi:hypothetical protein
MASAKQAGKVSQRASSKVDECTGGCWYEWDGSEWDLIGSTCMGDCEPCAEPPLLDPGSFEGQAENLPCIPSLATRKAATRHSTDDKAHGAICRVGPKPSTGEYLFEYRRGAWRIIAKPRNATGITFIGPVLPGFEGQAMLIDAASVGFPTVTGNGVICRK